MSAINYNSFFKSYDIRGTYPELDSRIYYWTGFALVNEILVPEGLSTKISVMRDCRYTSPEFYSALIQGIKDGGGEPIALGLGSTDLLYAACQKLNGPGAMVTASHNPKDDNGLKIVKQVPQMLGLSTGLDKIRDFVVAKLVNDAYKPETIEFATNEQVKQQVKDYYLEKLNSIGDIENVKSILKSKNQKLKIVVDCGNAMGGFVLPWVEEAYGDAVEFIKLFWDLDGNFPNHQADPLDFDTLKSLQSKILETKADLGIALDGDADRVYFVNKDAEIIKGDAVVAIIASSLLQDYFENNQDENLNPVVLFDQRSRRCVPEYVLQNAGIPVPTKVGHINFKKNMLKYGAIYGGEVSGHHYYHQFGAMDSGAMTITAFINILAKKPEIYQTVYSQIKAKYFTNQGEENITVDAGFTFETLKNKILEAYPDADYNLLDGVTLFYPDWKANIRMSNTEAKPVLRINIETDNSDFVIEKLREIRTNLGI